MKNKIILFCVFCALSLSVQAECESYFKMWESELTSKGEIDFSIASCKAWSLNPSLTIVILPFRNKNSDAEAGSYNLEIFISETNSGEIKARTTRVTEITYDAIRVTDIVVDTTFYKLNANGNAFGIRIDYAGSSNIYPFDTTNLNLYVMEGKKIRPVLTDFMVERRNGDWDGVCNGVFKTISRSIKIEPSHNESFARLKITERKKKTINKNENAACGSKNYIEKSKYFVMSYRNGYYTIPN